MISNPNLHTDEFAGTLDQDLLNYLEPAPPKNKENFLKMLRSYDPTKTTTFVGAGTSKPLGILDWPNLLERLLNHCEEGFKTAMRPRLEESDQWQELADQIFTELEKLHQVEMYHEIIRQAMTPSNNSATLTLIKMLLATKIHLTTNFDRSIENAQEFLQFMGVYLRNDAFDTRLSIKHVPDIEDFSMPLGNAVYYLHANIEQDIYILRKSQYDRYYPTVSKLSSGSKVIENCLRYFFKNNNIIFIGFSFADKYIREYLFSLSKEIEKENMIHQSLFSQEGKVYAPRECDHFMLIDASNSIWKKTRDKIFSEYEQYSILPIVYKAEQHLFIEKFFEYLVGRKINE